jgi:hypothetical protein
VGVSTLGSSPMRTPVLAGLLLATTAHAAHAAPVAQLREDVDGDGAADAIELTSDGVVRINAGAGAGAGAGPSTTALPSSASVDTLTTVGGSGSSSGTAVTPITVTALQQTGSSTDTSSAKDASNHSSSSSSRGMTLSCQQPPFPEVLLHFHDAKDGTAMVSFSGEGLSVARSRRLYNAALRAMLQARLRRSAHGEVRTGLRSFLAAGRVI